MNSLCMQFKGDKIQNHVLYLIPLIALEVLDKEGVVVDTVFSPPSICVPNPKKSKNIIFLPRSHENIYNDMV